MPRRWVCLLNHNGSDVPLNAASLAHDAPKTHRSGRRFCCRPHRASTTSSQPRLAATRRGEFPRSRSLSHGSLPGSVGRTVNAGTKSLTLSLADRYSTAPHVVDIIPDRESPGSCATTAVLKIKGSSPLEKRHALSIFASGAGATAARPSRHRRPHRARVAHPAEACKGCAKSVEDPEQEEQWRVFVDSIVRLEMRST